MKMKKALTVFAILLLLVFVSCKGESAYEIAVRNGFSGSEIEWLESLRGSDGSDGKGESAYEIALRNGYSGSESEWLESLKGSDGLDNKGESAYEIALRNGFSGSESEWLESLKGTDGSDGKGESAYEIAVRYGFRGSESEWIESLKGADGLSYSDASFRPGDKIIKKYDKIECSSDLTISITITLEAVRKLSDEEYTKQSSNGQRYLYKMTIEGKIIKGINNRRLYMILLFLPNQYTTGVGVSFDSNDTCKITNEIYTIMPISEVVYCGVQ